MNPITSDDLYKIVLERARRAEDTNIAARMVIGPLSTHDDLLAAVEDICRQLQQTREALADPMDYELVEDRLTPGAWRVEAVGDEGEVYVAIFSGPKAEPRAREYLARFIP